MGSLIKNENESKKTYLKRLNNYLNQNKIPIIKGLNTTDKVDRLIILEVKNENQELKQLVFETINSKIALKETLNFLYSTIDNLNLDNQEELHNLRMFKFRGNKELKIKEHLISISCIKK